MPNDQRTINPSEQEHVSGSKRDRAQAEAEAVLIIDKERANEAIEAHRRIASDAAELTHRSAEAVGQTILSGIETTARLVGAGLPGSESTKAAQDSSRSLQAILDSGAVIVGACQKLGQEWLDRATDRHQQRLNACADLLRCTNPADAAVVQIDLARHQFESYIEHGRRTSELFGEAATEALQKIKVQAPGQK